MFLGLAIAVPTVAAVPAGAAITTPIPGCGMCMGLGEDRDGNLLVGGHDSTLGRFSTSGTLLQVYRPGRTLERLTIPGNTAPLANGDIVVPDGNSGAFALSPAGAITVSYGGSGNAMAATVTPAGRVFVVYQGAARGHTSLARFDANGSNATYWSDDDYDWEDLRDVEYNPQNEHIYALDSGGSHVYELTQNGEVVRKFGGPAQINAPSGIAIDNAGDVYVAHQPIGSWESILKKFSATGVELASMQRPHRVENVLVQGNKLYYTQNGAGVHAVDLDRPIAALTGASSARTSQQLTFDASASFAPFASVSGYEWDLDGDGTFETNTGTSPTAARRFTTVGEQTVRVRVSGTAGGTDVAELRVSVTPSAATIATSPLVFAGQPVSFDASGSALPDSEITNVAWDFDGDGTYETDTGSGLTGSTSFPVVGTYRVSVRVTRSGGVVDEATSIVTARLSPPGGPVGVSINDGAQYTNSPNVTLSVTWPAFASGFFVSNDGGFRNARNELVAPTVTWKLDSSGPERLPKTVYLRFDGHTQNFSDDIILDETAPTMRTAQLLATGGRATTRAKKRRKSTTYRVKLSATDKTSGVAKMQFAVKKSKPLAAVRYKTTASVKSSSKPKFVRVQDRAGNFSKWKTLKAAKASPKKAKKK